MMRSLREFELEPQTSLVLRGIYPDAHDQHLIEQSSTLVLWSIRYPA
ncbi:hypothetical protein C4K35_2570 [Pseudomonas chlororaphis subsp. piscium]|nr:hypothetical protein C4K35_2570 [Pseudomonas chlororaphis subsp. piscium]AZC62956.1 hypothetical protein C4K33_2464 [Pseudomonas chlororaphis subsp. piscium]AZC69186.1 hypothetical protein C4K32_2524 [Pseudomonas chlororaphis subsp. piscium]AZC75365.1 hypothetical protein C4K31_2462 [Pseudomonas chlororaphis subsp. piscium]AZC81653.1 hypothetical protein C4K30_2539 [Pseudomonas chlororaphis subsp. piscium]